MGKTALEEKIQKSKDIIKKALKRFGSDRLVIAWTGGKDSTLMLWLYREVCRETGMKMPRCMFIDEGDLFDEIVEHVNRVKKKWNLDVVTVRNEDVLSKVKKIGDVIRVEDLNERNRRELERIGFHEKEFRFYPESYEGNHLMKTLPMNMFIEENGIKAVSTAIRWDEQDARKHEDYFSERENPKHIRVHPILHFTERDIWDATFKYKIPFCSLYRLGYRSLGIKSNTRKTSDLPAWEQDLENTKERSGRGQDKEKIMKRLRDLGYM